MSLNYPEPEWSAVPPFDYFFEVIKEGSVIDTVPLTSQAFFVVGRGDGTHLNLLHPSISRFHAVLQHREDGKVYLYDLGSTHGTFVNKMKLRPKVFSLIRVGDVIKFGLSTRLHVLGGPPELAAAREEVLRKRDKVRKARLQAERDREEAGCSWGIAEDAPPEEEDEEDHEEASEEMHQQSGHSRKRARSNVQTEPSEAASAAYAALSDEERARACPICARVFQHKHAKFQHQISTGHGLTGADVTGTAERKSRDLEAAFSGDFDTFRGFMHEQTALVVSEDELMPPPSKKAKSKAAMAAEIAELGEPVGGRARAASYADDDDDDDDFLDRTATTKRKRELASQPKVPTLTWSGVVARQAELKHKVQNLQTQIAEIDLRQQQTVARDTLDNYMVQITMQEQNKKRARLAEELAVLQQEDATLQPIAQALAPALPGLMLAAERVEEAERKRQQKLEATQQLLAAKRAEIETKKKEAEEAEAKRKADIAAKARELRKNLSVPLFNSTTNSLAAREAACSGPADVPPSDVVATLQGEIRQLELELSDTSPAKKPRRSVSSSTASKTSSSPLAGTRRAGPSVLPFDTVPPAPPPAPVVEDSCPMKVKDIEQPLKLFPDKLQKYAETDKIDSDKLLPGLNLRPKTQKSSLYSEDAELDSAPASFEEDEDLTTWCPPKGQSGDGRTALNAKYGY